MSTILYRWVVELRLKFHGCRWRQVWILAGYLSFLPFHPYGLKSVNTIVYLCQVRDDNVLVVVSLLNWWSLISVDTSVCCWRREKLTITTQRQEPAHFSVHPAHKPSVTQSWYWRFSHRNHMINASNGYLTTRGQLSNDTTTEHFFRIISRTQRSGNDIVVYFHTRFSRCFGYFGSHFETH